jgi:hypothetical protein
MELFTKIKWIDKYTKKARLADKQKHIDAKVKYLRTLIVPLVS